MTSFARSEERLQPRRLCYLKKKKRRYFRTGAEDTEKWIVPESRRLGLPG